MKFVDTSFWVALFFPADAHHVNARTLWADADDAITRSPKVSHIHVERAVADDAWAWLRRHDEREYSFVDATSFAVMRRRLREALAFDGDFAAAGFVETRP